MMEIKSICEKYKIRCLKLIERRIRGENLSNEEYKEARNFYQNTDEWLELRKKVGIRCNNICEQCNSAPYEDCHHLTYRRLFSEQLTDLLGVCRSCHTTLSKKKEKVFYHGHFRINTNRKSRK